MDPWMQSVGTVLVAIVASSGFWAWFGAWHASRNKVQNAMVRLLLGLAYDKIATMGLHYIDRGWITKDEYEEFRKYLYEPYKEFGGNGVAEQIMQQVSQLPLRSHNRYVIAQGRRHRENPNG